MRKLTFAIIFSIIAGMCVAMPMAQTQEHRGSGMRGKRAHADPQQQVERLGKKLNLTDAQKQQLLPVLADQQQQMKSVFADSSLSKEDRFAKIKTIRAENDQKINAILDNEQKQKYTDMKQQMRQRMQKRQKKQGTENLHQ